MIFTHNQMARMVEVIKIQNTESQNKSEVSALSPEDIQALFDKFNNEEVLLQLSQETIRELLASDKITDDQRLVLESLLKADEVVTSTQITEETAEALESNLDTKETPKGKNRKKSISKALVTVLLTLGLTGVAAKYSGAFGGGNNGNNTEVVLANDDNNEARNAQIITLEEAKKLAQTPEELAIINIMMESLNAWGNLKGWELTLTEHRNLYEQTDKDTHIAQIDALIKKIKNLQAEADKLFEGKDADRLAAQEKIEKDLRPKLEKTAERGKNTSDKYRQEMTNPNKVIEAAEALKERFIYAPLNNKDNPLDTQLNDPKTIDTPSTIKNSGNGHIDSKNTKEPVKSLEELKIALKAQQDKEDLYLKENANAIATSYRDALDLYLKGAVDEEYTIKLSEAYEKIEAKKIAVSSTIAQKINVLEIKAGAKQFSEAFNHKLSPEEKKAREAQIERIKALDEELRALEKEGEELDRQLKAAQEYLEMVSQK